ncbi:MAG: sigma-70 family RNA polymerase sigma factor [Chloroflexi bacterium]|nr:sigma-70 family RNA polymerase sigma factor [Chloroflexota bacterium]
MSNQTNTAQPNEAQFVAALKAGNQAAFAEMVERYSPTVYNLALRLMNNAQEAEDVLQETFISAFRALDRFEGRSQLGTWLYRIAYNAALMRLRRRQIPTTSIDEPLTTEEGESLPRQLVDWTALPEDLLLSGELRHVLDAAVAVLPATLRSVFVLRDIEGLSTAETADALNLTETNVKVRLHRARLALREQLTAYFAPVMPADRPAGHGHMRGEAYTRVM